MVSASVIASEAREMGGDRGKGREEERERVREWLR